MILIGCPEVGELYEINRQAKMQYKYAVRWLKRAAFNIDKYATYLQIRFSIVFKKRSFRFRKKRL